MNVVFELGISLGELSKVRFEDAAVPKLDDAHTWFVRCVEDRVTIHALHKGKVREIGRAAWVRGRMIERASDLPELPNDHQWKLIGTALGRVSRRASQTKAPVWRRIPRVVIGPIIVAMIAIAATAMIFVVRTDEPVTDSIAAFDAMTWADVERGGETTVPLILKDAERERGRKLCVKGTIDEIERAKVNGRDVHSGTLRADGVAVRFIALGSTRTIVTRYAGTLCGIAHGKQIVGIFDLPENRQLEK